MVDMSVCDPNGLELGAARFDGFDEALTLSARINDHSPVRSAVDEKVAIFLECSDGKRLDVHV
jgi:hypothetical protein